MALYAAAAALAASLGSAGTASADVLGRKPSYTDSALSVMQLSTMPAGIEDISFDREGGLWAVSEAGSKRWFGWRTFFPLIFRLQPALLR